MPPPFLNPPHHHPKLSSWLFKGLIHSGLPTGEPGHLRLGTPRREKGRKMRLSHVAPPFSKRRRKTCWNKNTTKEQPFPRPAPIAARAGRAGPLGTFQPSSLHTPSASGVPGGGRGAASDPAAPGPELTRRLPTRSAPGRTAAAETEQGVIHWKPALG